MLNANDMRAVQARRQEMERAARKQRAASETRNTQRTASRSAWARFAALFL